MRLTVVGPRLSCRQLGYPTVTAVHQLLPVFSVGDAIGGAVLRTQAMLERLGFESRIYAETRDQRLAARTLPAARIVEDAGAEDAVLYHLSIGSAAARLFAAVPSRRCVVYHNITPAAWYRATNPRVTYWLERGREDLARLAPLAELVIGDSTFNLEEARIHGARLLAVVPPPADLQRLRPRPSQPSDPPLILSVGRIAPNKRLEELVRMLAALRATSLPGARLVLAGSADDTEVYVARLHAFARRLGVADAVDLSGRRRDDGEIGDLYASAAVLVSASEHEGFCVPLLEAMAFEVPVVALARGAVPETLDGAGILLDRHDPLLWAAAVARAAGDAGLRACLAAAGRRRLLNFSEAAVERALAAALASAGIQARS